MPRKATLDEKREARISVIVKPSLYRDIALLADSQGVSINAFIEKMLVRTAEANAQVINEIKASRDKWKNLFVDVEPIKPSNNIPAADAQGTD